MGRREHESSQSYQHRLWSGRLWPTLCLLTLLSQGCMASPSNGQTVTDRGTRLSLFGFHTNPSAPVRVLAFDFVQNRYEEVASTTSRTTPVSDQWWDDTLYEWDAGYRTLGNEYWKAGRCAGYTATLKGETTVSGNRYGMYSWDMDKNAEGCTTRYRTNSEWALNCSANQSKIYTTDYEDNPRDNTIRISGMNPNETCTALDFSFLHDGSWNVTSGQYRVGSTNRSLSCTENAPSSSGRVSGRCRLNAGGPSSVRSIIEARRTQSATVTLSARDLECRDRSSSTSSTILGSSSYDYDWTRWSGFHSQCAEPAPPPPTSDPRSHTVVCTCVDATGTASATLNACIDNSGGADAVVTGAALMCGFAERDIESLTRLDTTCRMASVSDPGATCSRAGNYSITSIVPR